MKTLFEAIRELPEGAKPEDYEFTADKLACWLPLYLCSPFINSTVQIRRKQKMLEINGIKYHEPCREMPPVGTKYYYPVPSAPKKVCYAMVGSVGIEFDRTVLSRGLMHLVEKAAIQQSDAMLGIREEAE